MSHEKCETDWKAKAANFEVLVEKLRARVMELEAAEMSWKQTVDTSRLEARIANQKDSIADLNSRIAELRRLFEMVMARD